MVNVVRKQTGTDAEPVQDAVIVDGQAAPGADQAAESAQEWGQIEADLGAGAAPVPAAPVETNTAAELLGALQLARAMVTPLFTWWPDFGQVWGDGQLQGIADAGGQVMDRHGWTMGGAMSEYGPYIALLGATAGPGLATYQAIKAHREDEARKARESANLGRTEQAPS